MVTARSAQILSGLTRATFTGAQAGGLPSLLVEACAAALPVTGVGLVWMTNTGPGSMLAATDGPARVLEELQFTLGEGPCVESSTTGRPVLHPDLERTGAARWPGFTAGALEAGVRAVFAFPLQVGGIRVGVLDLYRDQTGVLGDAEVTEALAFADAATTILLHLQADAEELHPLLAEAIGYRTVVHQATGMIAAQLDAGLAEALVMLRARSYALERPVTDVAVDVVARRLRFHQ
ncbi:GAF domain-containing protein [Kribbella qitaiheensis]|nr:GAF domain-containing protein [Kribbella qitaiheensis]